MAPHEESFDPAWWSSAFSGVEPVGYEAPDGLSLKFDQQLTDLGLTGRRRDVIQALAIATSAELVNGNWLQPFRPQMQFVDRRSALPSDLEPDQLVTLAELAPVVSQPSLRARVADVAWLYGDRSNTHLLEFAIDAYRAAPLEPDVWFGGGKDAWQRAFGLVARRGRLGDAVRSAMTADLSTWVLGATVEEQYMVVDCASNTRLDAATQAAVVAHLVALAAEATASPGLARDLELAAASWLPPGHDRSACIERAARTYVAEADTRVAAEPGSGAVVEGLMLEKALAMLLTLPRTYRDTNGLPTLIHELRTRLVSSREVTIESMMRVETEAIDLSGAAAAARARVAGVASGSEALALFASLLPPMDADGTKTSAAKIISGSFSRLFASTTFSRDGRKVAVRHGVGPDADDASVWAEQVRMVGFHAQGVARGLILPAQAVLTFEHSYDRGFITRICAESPIVPEGHAALWGAGISLGLEGDYGLAVAVLVPQLEQLIRATLKRNGIYTLLVDDGVETEKSLNALLEMAEAADALGAGMVMEFKALLIDQSGPNLRNEIAHGLFNDVDTLTYVSVYVWWSCLRLVVWPWWTMSRNSLRQTDDEAVS